MATKITIFALCLLCTTAMFGQQSVGGSAINAQVSPLQFADHEAFASQKPMGTEHSLIEGYGFTSGQGERPLWEVAPVSHVTPLGDSARLLKKQHEASKKADFIWNNN